MRELVQPGRRARASRAWPACLALVATASLASAQDGQQPGTWVLPPGQEQVLLGLLGGDDLGGCTLEGIQVERTAATARYRCGASQPAIVLAHPSPSPPRGRPALARTPHALIASDGPPPPPPALVDALRAHLARDGGRLAWRRIEAHTARAPDVAVPESTWSEVVRSAIVAVSLAAAIALLLRRRAARGRLARAVAPAIGAALAIALGATLEAAGVAYVCGAIGLRSAAIGLALLTLPGLASISALTWLWRRRERRRGDAVIAAFTAVAVAATSLVLGIADARAQLGSYARLGELTTGQTPGAVVDGDPRRIRVEDRWNRRGLRGPDWDDHAPPGARRIALIGDSFVAGLGVRWPDTLGERLRHALPDAGATEPLELVNLGIPGHNLADHVDVYRVARAELDPDVVILCLTLPNDLSEASIQTELVDAARPSGHALARAVLGRPMTEWILAQSLARSVDARARAVLDREIARLRREREAHPGPPLAVFGYAWGEELLGAPVASVPGAFLVPAVPSEPDHAIPGDGHPTASANEAYARRIAATLMSTPSTAAILSRTDRARR